MSGRSKAVSQARAKPVLSTAERVEYVAGMMRRGEWKRGKSGRALAAEWGVSADSMFHVAAEASRLVAREVTDPQAVQETVATALAVNLERASKDREYRSVAALGDVWTRVVGARAPERHEHAVMMQQFDTLDRAGKLRWLDERIAKLQEARTRLLASEAVTMLPEGTR